MKNIWRDREIYFVDFNVVLLRDFKLTGFEYYALMDIFKF